MKPKEYRATHKELWQRFVRLEPKPKPLEPEDKVNSILFWSIAVAVLWLGAILIWCWWYPEPINKLFPHIRG